MATITDVMLLCDILLERARRDLSNRMSHNSISSATVVIFKGLNLAMFRDDRGEAHVLDGYCPHMGANLGAGGQVVGDCIECPFHGWLFRGHDGKCTKIPYADKVPDIAKVKAWPSLEVNGWIYLWHHAEDIEPTWKPPEMEEITNGTWVFRGRSEHIINAHIEEIPENGADVYHLKEVHGPSMFAGTDLRYMWSKFWGFTQHQWKAKWEANPAPEGHIGTISLTHELELFGKSLPGLTMHVTGRQVNMRNYQPEEVNIHRGRMNKFSCQPRSNAMNIGPGIVYLMFDTFFGKGVYIQALTPVEPMVQKLVHNIYVHWAMPAVYAKFLLHAEAIQVERDIMIWNNKKYEARPMFVKAKEDSLIAKHRRWFSQFYSEHSPRLKFKKETLEW